MNVQITNILYLVSAICFIMSLRGLSSPRSAIAGSVLGVCGMVIAIGITFLNGQNQFMTLIITILLGGGLGTVIARKVPMTSMPELVAGFHSFVGLAAVLISTAAILNPNGFNIAYEGQIIRSSLIEISIGAVIGSITFTGSIVAFLKLFGIIPSKPIKVFGQQYFCALLSIVTIALVVYLIVNKCNYIFLLIIILASIIGILLIIPVGGADMPVIISMLNSYSGWAAVGIGFTLSNSLLIITGALIGTSGAILSHIMCKAMNRSLFLVIFGTFFVSSNKSSEIYTDDREINISSEEDVAFQLKRAEKVIIVPGYGMAIAQSQHALKEIVEYLDCAGIQVQFAIHPVAGRMPGHMNVLLAEANIDYDRILELGDINNDFVNTDIVLVVGANDVTNPSAKTDKTSPIYGMPILNVAHAKAVYFIKRSMAVGYAGIQNEQFFEKNTMMLFGDAKKVIEGIMRELKSDI